MIQILWAFDFIGIFLSRVIISYIYFIKGLEIFKQNKIHSIILFLSGSMIGLGLLTSIVSLFWILFYLVFVIKSKKIDTLSLSLMAYFIILISAGPGILSLDRFFELRLTN